MKTLACLCLATLLPLPLMAQNPQNLRTKLDNLLDRGMWRDALTLYSEQLLPISDAGSDDDLVKTFRAVQELNAWNEFDALVERAVDAHPQHARLLTTAATLYQSAPHSGRLIAGQFERGQQTGFHPMHRGRGGSPDAPPKPSAGAEVNTSYRDHVRSLQLLRQALAHAGDNSEQTMVWAHISNSFSARESWKLQTLTPLETLPEWGEPGPEGGTEGAPWTANGPLLYDIPVSWEAAKNDGERWRFSLSERIRLTPDSSTQVTLELARFSESQFGTQTLADFGWWQRPDPEISKGILEVDTLTEDECLAKTSDGIRRFKLPATHHFIALYQSILDQSADAGDALANVFLNRRQYHKARAVLEQTIAKHGPGQGDQRRQLLEQITGNWGRFDPAETTPTGVKPRIPLIFRNATRISLTAAPVNMDAVLQDTIALLKSNPRDLETYQLSPSAVAWQIIQGKYDKHIGKVAATWTSDLKPRENHRETRTELEMPLDDPGAWWITGKMENGNEFHTLVWIVDSVIVRREVAGKSQWWLADAASGAPVPNAEIRFFGYRIDFIDRKIPLGRRMNIRTSEFNRTTDPDGKTLLAPGDFDPNMQWLAVAKKPGNAPTFFGFSHISALDASFENGNRDITYGISDRPLYRPGDTAHLKFFLRNTGYFNPDESRWAGKTGTLRLLTGRGDEAIKIENLTTDALGSVESEVMIPKDAALGSWSAQFHIGGEIAAQLTFRVEEYRKPEYEVKVEAPAEPVRLGEKFTATVKANYFHGAPVRNASVEIIVKRTSLGERWFPVWRWDWLYGPGAWWNSPLAKWHPTWEKWGCIPPRPPWWIQDRWTPDELVLKKLVPIGEDGNALIEIDTAPAKAAHGDMDAKYVIEARVTDASRREERGTGSVIAARKPFEVVVWTNRGYAKSGEQVEATVSASTLAGKPVAAAKGLLTFYQLTIGGDGRIAERKIESWPLETNAEGEARHGFAAPATGQYRLVASFTWKGGETVEGATILNVHGPGRDDPAMWKFGPLELVSDKSDYQPGDTLKLRVNSDHENAHVWLFLHIAGSAGREAKRIQLNGKSSGIEIPLTLQDMPNMFIEGVTVHGAKVHEDVRQVLLPPVSKLIDVALEPAKTKVKPREKSSLRIQLHDAEGKPFAGKAVVAIYDKALEAITGGSNVPPIHEQFWSWKNHYYPRSGEHSLPPQIGNLLRQNVVGMQPLGRFGDDPFADSSLAAEGMGFGAAGELMRMDAATATAPLMMKARGVPSEAGAAVTPILVRKEFADLLKWVGNIETGADGTAEVNLEFPDNLTTWKARVWTLGSGTRVGEGTAEIITSKELLVRLQAPRFLVERDEAVLSAVVHNDHNAAKTVRVSLELEGGNLESSELGERTVEIAARSEKRVDWRVKAVREGDATLRMKADAGNDGDAVERSLPVRVHGMSRQDAWSRMIEPNQESTRIVIRVPEQRRADQSLLTVRFSPTIAGAVVDAIPYLASYPHGCTEQTLNRFVPAVIAQQMLRKLGVNLADVKAKRANLNPQELGDAADRASQWKQWKENPVFDEVEIEKMVQVGVEKLMSMQNADGGWGWFSGFGEQSYPHTTAVVVHGLIVAKQNGADIPQAMLDLGVAWLVAYEQKQVEALQRYVANKALREQGKRVLTVLSEKPLTDATDAFVRMVLGETGRDSEPMLELLYRDRMKLPVYAKCLVGLEHHRKGDAARRDEVMKMISQFLKRDAENQTAYLDLGNNGYWWFWYGSEVEAHAWFLKLLSAVKPDRSDTRGLVKYLVNNRKHASYWESTRDTAFAIEAIADYYKASGEDAPEMSVDVLIDGKSVRQVGISRDNLFTFDGTVTLAGEAVTTGEHVVELRKSGKGPLYANAYLKVFTLEEKLRAAGLEMKVQRKVSKLVELEKDLEVPDSTGLVTTQRVERFRREPLSDGSSVASGDRIEVELILESKNDYEYMIFSDAKAAGFEALDALSGYIEGEGGFNAYMEPRDQSVDFFIRALPRGTHTLRYQLRAEAPGNYKALPATATAMYAPELSGNSEDLRLEIRQSN